MNEIILGDCLEELKKLPANSVDAVVTDPPYGLSFMGKKWDYDVPSEDVWRECLRVLKPGGHLLAFAGTRTQHRMAVRIEDAGFEIRDMIAWVYGSGFPKSLNIGKAVDKLQGNEREDLGEHIQNKTNPDSKNRSWQSAEGVGNKWKLSKGTSPWEGWGTALKPALEPITVARKHVEGTVAENVLTHGVGGLNIDGCRVNPGENVPGGGSGRVGNFAGKTQSDSDLSTHRQEAHSNGRFPANLIHDGSEGVVGLFPESKSSPYLNSKAQNVNGFHGGVGTDKKLGRIDDGGFKDSGSAARFFYCAKSSKRDRGEGNNHPTVKPIALMEYLVKLVTKEGQTVLDPFLGSGTTAIACKNLNRKWVGIERESEYVEIAQARLKSLSDKLF